MGIYIIIGISSLVIGILIGMKLKGKVHIGWKQSFTQTFNED